jgi:CheY-like chemotaxis protein
VPKALAMVEDLMFLSRIAAAAPSGVGVVSVRTAGELLQACRPEPPFVVILDLDSPTLPTLDSVRALRAEAATRGLAVVGFFSHVRPERGREALAAGCSRVLPRSRFVAELPALLARPGAGGR